MEATPKAVVLKLRDSVLPACAKLAEAGDSEVREAGQAAMVAFAVRAGSMGILDKVGRRAEVARHAAHAVLTWQVVLWQPRGPAMH